MDSKHKTKGKKNKKTALGENLNDIISIELKEQEFHQNMLQYIDSVISIGAQHDSLAKMKFIFIHVNWFYTREVSINKYDFCPAEFAVAEFSLQNGIENMYHEIVNSKIALGWRGDAIETSQQTHRIPVEFKEAQSDFLFMYNKLIALLESNKSGNKYPPLFTTKDVTLGVHSLLDRMCAAAKQNRDDFLVYSIEALFGALRNTAAQTIHDCSIPLVVAEIEFSKDLFSAEQGLECEFHKILDGTSPYCSMSIVKRWGFTVCDYCCQFLSVTMVEGIHCPRSQPIDGHAIGDEIHKPMKALSIGGPKFISVTGVSEEHRIKVSERTDHDEQKRRNHCRPLEIIDHSSLDIGLPITTQALTGRPLRLPKNKSIAEVVAGKTNDFDDSDFPTMGRGGAIKKKQATGMKLSLGRGSGSR